MAAMLGRGSVYLPDWLPASVTDQPTLSPPGF